MALSVLYSPLFCDMNNTCRKEIQISKKHDPQNQSSTLQHPTPTNQTTTSLATDGVLCVSLVAKVLFLFTASCEIVCSNPAESPLSTSHSPTATADGRSKQAWDETNPNRRHDLEWKKGAEQGNLVVRRRKRRFCVHCVHYEFLKMQCREFK